MKAKTLSIVLKVRDMFGAIILDSNGNEIGDYDGYVPEFFPGEHYGDYVELDIDIATGRIVNWNVPTDEDIDKMIKEGKERSDRKK
jgi:sporulation protein YlmC with PRC-barrel domain